MRKEALELVVLVSSVKFTFLARLLEANWQMGFLEHFWSCPEIVFSYVEHLGLILKEYFLIVI